MKKFFLTMSLAIGCSVTLPAAPGYVSLSGYGNATAGAQVILPADPATQARLVTVNWSSDTNNAVLSITEGLGAYTITQTNALSTSVTNLIDRTNGLSSTSVLVLQHAGTCYAANVSTWNSSTTTATNGGVVTGGINVVLASGGWGVKTSIGDSVYIMSTATTLPVGATTNFQSGSALFASQYQGRPLMVQLTPALVTNRLYSVTFRRD